MNEKGKEKKSKSGKALQRAPLLEGGMPELVEDGLGAALLKGVFSLSRDGNARNSVRVSVDLPALDKVCTARYR